MRDRKGVDSAGRGGGEELGGREGEESINQDIFHKKRIYSQ